MAATKGTFTAYNQLRPLTGGVTELLDNQQQVQFQKAQMKLEEDKLDELRKEKQKQKEDKLLDLVKSKIPLNPDTKVKSVNELNNILIQKAVEEIGSIGAILEEDLNKNNLTFEERARLHAKLDTLNQLPENILRGTSQLTQIAKNYWDGVQKGTVRRNVDYEKFADIGTNGWYAELDENGRPLLAFDKNLDADGDGKIDVIDYDSIMSGVPKFQFKTVYDKENLLKEAITKIQPEVNQNVQGGLIVKTTGLDDNAVRKHVSDLFYKSDGTPSDVLESFAIDNNVDINDKKALKGIEDDFINSMKLYAKSGREESPNPQQLEREKFNYQKTKDRKEEEEKKTTYEVVATPPVYTDAKVNSAKGYKTVSVIGSKAVPLIEGYVNGKKVSYTNAKINSYTVVKNSLGNRKIVAEVIYEDTKGQNIKNEELDGTASTSSTVGAQNKSAIVYLTQKDAIKYAKQMGFESTTEMANQARVSEKEQTGNTESAAERAARIANGG